MTDLEVIQAFKEQISYADKTTIIEVELICGEKKKGLDAGELVHFPVHWQYFEILTNAHLDRTIWDFCSKQKAQPGFIVWGDPSRAEVERIFMSQASFPSGGVDIDFLNTQARIWNNSLKRKCLDGLSWLRSLENVVKNGLDAAPIWEWD